MGAGGRETGNMEVGMGAGGCETGKHECMKLAQKVAPETAEQSDN